MRRCKPLSAPCRKRAPVLGLLLLLSTLSATAAPRAARAAPRAGLLTVEGLTSYRLANGLQVLLIPEPAQTKVTVAVTYFVGSRHEGYGETGMAHLLEHMLFKGTSNRAPGVIDQQVQDAGGYMNAYTSFDRTVYHIDVPNTGAKIAVDILCDIMMNATLPADGSSRAPRLLEPALRLELALVLPAMEGWVQALQPGEPFCSHGDLPDDATGAGFVEAARGSLGHWLSIRRGRIDRYQIIAPTTWNFSPRDSQARPGPLEQALVGLPAGEGALPTVQHVVRSFDPCMVCTVH